MSAVTEWEGILLKPHEVKIFELDTTKHDYCVCIGMISDGWENTDASKAELKKSLLVLKGDWTEKEIPKEYFSGLQSVVSPIEIKAMGKNLLALDNKNIAYIDAVEDVKISSNECSGTLTIGGDHLLYNDGKLYHGYVRFSSIRLEAGEVYTCSFNSSVGYAKYNAINNTWTRGARILFRSIDGKKEYDIEIQGPTTFTCKKTGDYIIVCSAFGDIDKDTSLPFTLSNIQIEKGTKATEYEPYREEIQTIYTEPLRSIGDIKDEIDIDKGIIIRRIGEIILDGSDDEKWVLSESSVTNNTWLEAHSSYKYKDGGLNAIFKDTSSL